MWDVIVLFPDLAFRFTLNRLMFLWSMSVLYFTCDERWFSWSMTACLRKSFLFDLHSDLFEN